MLASVSVDSGTIPQRGYLNATGFNLPVVAGTQYWVVLSTTSSKLSVPLMRMVSPFRFYCLKGYGNGSKWDYCAEGPTDWAFKVFTTAEALGNPVIQALSLPVTTSNFVAQPFVAPSTGQINCVWLAGVSSSTTVTICPDNGSGAPNLSQPLASGTYGSPYTFFYSSHYISVSGPNPTLQSGTKYWLVIYSATGSAANVTAIYYWARYGPQGTDQGNPAGLDVLVSGDSGASWSPAYQGPSAITFQIGYSTGQFNTATSSTTSSSTNGGGTTTSTLVATLDCYLEHDLLFVDTDFISP